MIGETAVAQEAAANGTAGGREYPPRRVYAVAGVPPEVQAYALAKYSRSRQGILESVRELSQQQAEQFLNTFYFQYGHGSIADLAHLVFGLEQISILAAIAVVDEQLWDGQERSTRYQPFSASGWHLPAEIAGTAAEPLFSRTAEGLFAAYAGLTSALRDFLIEAVPRPPELPDAAYRRTLRARAFDVSRALLPLATCTSVGQIVSARVLERQVSRLLGSDYAELRQIGAELKSACQAPPETPMSTEPQPPLAPTLVKYAEPAPYPAAAAAELTAAASALLAPLGEPDRSALVQLVEPPRSPLDELVATLLYRFDPGGHAFQQILSVVEALGEPRKQELLALSVRDRGPHDGLLREHQAGASFIFDVLVDLGAFRDLHRHRRCTQVMQPLGWSHAFEPPEEVFAWGLGPEVALSALEAGLGEVYEQSLFKAEHAAQQVAQINPRAADYLLPLAYRVRCLFKMDWAQAAYLIEQRTQPQGHFSYRRVAWAMYEALRARWPALAEPIRAVDPGGALDLLRR